MDGSLILYHGSDKIIKNPVYGAGKINNDFGMGFYCTTDIELAKEWSCSSQHGGFANQYSFDVSGLNILNINSRDYSVLNWMAVLVNNRIFRIRNPIAGRAKRYLTENFDLNIKSYDVVIGYRADDAYFDFADAFLNNAITVEQLSRAMVLGKLGEQYVIVSKYAFERIRYENSFYAEKEVYFAKRKARNDEAERAYLSMLDECSDGLFMIDIIRKGLKNDDERIPRNIS